MLTNIFKKYKENLRFKLVGIELVFVMVALMAHIGVQMLNYFPLTASLHFLILNVVIIYLIHRFFYILFNRVFVSVLLSGPVWIGLALINHYVYKARGSMFVPWDILAAKTAGDVAGQYEFKIYGMAVLWILIWLACAIMSYFFVDKKINPYFTGKKRLIYGFASVIGVLVLFLGMIKSPLYKEIPDRLYNVERYYKNQGIVVTFFNYSKFLFIIPPEGYSTEKCQTIVEEYVDGKDVLTTENTPLNIIVIMNESFTDFKSLGNLPEIDDCLSFCNGLKENVVRGNLYVPVFGGTTVNTEYEFLTGNSISYQKGCPFSYAVRTDRPSVVRVLNDLGYESYGMHPATGNNWNRDLVYPYLGLKDFISLEDIEYTEKDTINDHISDDWDVSKLIDMYENKTSDRLFIFNVSMQNHGGYEFDFEKETGEAPVDLSAYGNYPMAENYLALLKKSDEAFEKLITYFEDVDEPTMIVMFGDHMPNIENEFFDTVNGESIDTENPQENIKKFVTPFIIWTNYDIEEKYYDRMSANFLPELMLETADIELPAYYEQLRELREKYPVVSVNGTYDSNSEFYVTDDITREDELLLNYKYMEFNNANARDEDIIWEASQR